MAPKKGQHTRPEAELKGAPVVIRVTGAERSALQRIAARKKLPITYFIREGIQLVIEKYGEKK